MHKIWGKPAHNLRVIGRTTSAWLSPIVLPIHVKVTQVGAQVQLVHTSFPTLPQLLSPGKFTILPLIEHYLYPVSTAPITNPIKRI